MSINKEQIEALKQIRAHLLKDYNDPSLCLAGLCWYVHYDSITIDLPLFTVQNAIKYANADPSAEQGTYWWECNGIYNRETFDLTNRLLFIDWMINELKGKSIWQRCKNYLKSARTT